MDIGRCLLDYRYMKYYTGTGDKGTSTLYGASDRLPKDNPIFEALGSLDELNSFLSICRAHAKRQNEKKTLKTIQKNIFIVQAEVGASKKSPVETITEKKVKDVEWLIASFSKDLPDIRSFVISGESLFSAHLDYARALARRTERVLVALKKRPGAHTLVYMNRLSSILFVMARAVNAEEKIEEKKPDYT